MTRFAPMKMSARKACGLLLQTGKRGIAAQASLAAGSEGAAHRESWLRVKDAFAPGEKEKTQIIFLGCPGVGKGTYASRLSRLLDVPHIAVGDLVRQELQRESPLSLEMRASVSQGQLLPDRVVAALLSHRLTDGAAKGERGFILDGFPRTTAQAEFLDSVARVDMVVNLRLREDILVSKCLGRRTCKECGGNFNMADIDVPAEEGSPRIVMPPLLPPAGCSDKMITREDDTISVIKERLKVFYNESQPVELYYKEQGLLLDFNVAGGIPETWPLLLEAMNLSFDTVDGLVQKAA